MRPFISFAAAVALSATWLVALPPAIAQQPIPEKIQPESPSAAIPENKLNAAGAALGRVAALRTAYKQKIATATDSDKGRLADEANDAMRQAVTDQGLSVGEYNSILETAQNDPKLRQQLVELAQRALPEK
ncbi:MAG TPA: DUF4168 domain-containing protein [Stellaceae bacterium]|jgi:hypothetical protein|nr:DUF4168 domain-containing protein [Stellaceae bacterium]